MCKSNVLSLHFLAQSLQISFFSYLKSAMTDYTLKKSNHSLWPSSVTLSSITAPTSYKQKVVFFPPVHTNLSTSVSRKQSIYLTNHKTIFCDVKKLWTLPMCQSICKCDESSNKYSRAWEKKKIINLGLAHMPINQRLPEES